MENTPVAIVMGSKSDLDIVQGAFDILDKFGVKFTARVLSAHRTPAEAAEFAATAEEKGFKKDPGASKGSSGEKGSGRQRSASLL